MIRCIIVDDEEKSRDSLKIILEDFCENVEVVALCENLGEATNAIRNTKPDLVFLDIQLQGEMGFDLFQKAGEITFEVIFTTAFSDYAVKAFRFSAIDYLLKPIDITELQNALQKVEKRVSQSMTARLEQLITTLKGGSMDSMNLALPSTDGLLFVKVKEILYCIAKSNYTEITLINEKKYVVSKTLKEYEDLLEEYNFFRIHNSYIINLGEIKKYVRGDGGFVVMSDEKKLDVSKRRKDTFLERISMRS